VLLIILRIAAVSLAIMALIAIGLILSQPARPVTPAAPSLDFGAMHKARGDAWPTVQAPVHSYTARDGSTLPYRWFPTDTPAAPTLILLHGSAWHSAQFIALATRLAQDGSGNVAAPDLRGHGFDPKRRGDVDHLGQLEEDIADLIAHLAPKGPVILGGHSSGGGLAVRFAGGPFGHLADGFVLIAPFLKYNAPTQRPNSGGWARPLTRRLIGLAMLNAAHIRALNGLTVIQFAIPEAERAKPRGATFTDAYSYRLNASYAPRSDYKGDLAAMTQPFLLIAGDADEAFYSGKYESVISEQTGAGRYRILPGVGHLDIVDNASAFREINAFIRGL